MLKGSSVPDLRSFTAENQMPISFRRKTLYETLGFELTGTESGKMPGNEDFSVEVNLLERKIDG